MNYNTTVPNVVTTDTSEYDDIFTITSSEESSSTILHQLHTNERQLRTLAVVLSLTGGLALSFALGVGILIYWYSRRCKEKRKGLLNKNECNDGDDTSSLYCPSCRPQQLSLIVEATTSTSSHSLLLLDNLPPPPPMTVPTPEPSAPTEKEIHMASRHDHERLCHSCSNPPPAYTKE